MIISSGTKYRSIASQNILSYAVDLNLDNTTGTAFFGFSGDNTNLNLFTFRTGKIYDINNRHVWSYNPAENLTFSGNINTGDHNYYINNNLICLSTPKNNNFFKYFYAGSENSNLNINSFIYGNNNPNYSIEFPFENFVGDNITGLIFNNSVNNNFSFQIFTGSTSAQEYYTLNNFFTGFISGGRSGNFVFRYNSNINSDIFSSGVLQFNTLGGFLSLQTNFGTINYDLNNVNIKSKPFYFIDFVEILTGIFDDIFYRYNYVYELRTKSPTNQNVIISLSNHTGHTGDLYYTGFTINGQVSGRISGFIYGDDYLTGFITGLGISALADYSGNFPTGILRNFKNSYQLATGFLDYFYNLPVGGGSGLAPAPPGTFIEATGYVSQNDPVFINNTFIYGSRFVTGSKTGLLTGDWFNLRQTGTGFINVIFPESLSNFTGNILINNSNFSWNGVPYIGYEIENFDNKYKIYGITGSGGVVFTTFEPGVNTNKDRIITQQSTGSLVQSLFKLSSYDINFTSGTTFGSENEENLIYVFGTDSDSTWYTSPTISTGFLGFEFTNFSPSDSGVISYYEIILKKNFSDFFSQYRFVPLNFKLQGSNNLVNWIDMDSRNGVNFYEPYSNVFNVTNTGLFNSVRLLITSGIEWPHINKNVLDTYSLGLSIDKINFYKQLRTVSGLYSNLIDNNIENNFFISSKNTGDPIYFSNTTGFGSFGNNYRFSGLNISDDWSSINMSLNGTVYVATAKNSYVYVSRNSGSTWETGISLKRDWRDSAISFDGRVITVAAFGDKIYTSYNSGINWQNNFNNINEWVSVDISYDGRNQIALVRNSTNPIFVSYNSGIIWSGLSSSNMPNTIDDTNFNSVAISKTGRFALAAGDFDLFYSTNTGLNWIDYSSENLTVATRAWKSVALSADGRIWGGVAYYNDLQDNPNYIDKVWINRNSGDTNFWTGIPFYTGLDILSDGKLSSISLSFDGVRQAIATRRAVSSIFTGEFFTTDGGIYTSLNTGIQWRRGITMTTGNLLENFVDVSISSGGSLFLGVPAKQPDFLISNDSQADLWKALNSDKEIHPYVELTGKMLGYKTYKAYQNNILTGFYISFEGGYSPGQLEIQVSSSGDNYLTIYRKTGNISLIESGILSSGVNITTSSGYKYFRFQFGAETTGPSTTGLDSTSPIICYTGWNKNTGSVFNQWRSLAMTRDGRIQFGVGLSGSGDASIRYTGFVYRSTNYGIDWSIFNITGKDNGPIEEIQLNNIAIDKNTGRYILISRDGEFFNTGIQDSNALNYKIYLSTTSGDSVSSIINNYNLINNITGGGRSLDMNNTGNIVFMGDTNRFLNSGAVSIYTGNINQNQIFRQLITGGANASGFGSSISTNLNGSILIVGNPNSFENSGSAVIFTGNATAGWSFQQRITGSPNGTTSRYGFSSATDINSNVIILGGPTERSNTGAAIIFTGNQNNGWVFRQRISGFTQRGTVHSFGNSVATDSGANIIFVGVPNTNLTTGTVEIFTGNAIGGWTRRQVLSGFNNDHRSFGAQISNNSNGSILVVGAQNSYLGTGTAIIYTGNAINGWGFSQELTGNGSGAFGRSVVLNSEGNIIVVGGNLNNLNSGSVLIYTGTSVNGWQLIQQINNTGDTGQFGTSLAINSSGNVLAIGAPSNSPSGALIYNFTGINNIINGFVPTGFDGAWKDVAMSHDGRVMIAVGYWNNNASNIQISTNTGVTWTLQNLNGLSFYSVAMSSGADVMYLSEPDWSFWRSLDTGLNWGQLDTNQRAWKNVATSYDGRYVTVVTDDNNNVFTSSDSGISLINILQNNYAYTDVAISSGGQYQIVTTSQNRSFRSDNFGNTWTPITGLGLNSHFGCDISANGRYQIIGRNNGKIFSNCTFGLDLPGISAGGGEIVRIKNANFYLANQKDFFNYQLNDITGYGLMSAQVFGTGIGLLSPTGTTYQPAISYQTGRITGLLENIGALFVSQLDVGGTGRAGNVYLNTITGVREATGIINFNTGFLSNLDFITIGDYFFTYVTGNPTNSFQFNNLNRLVNVLTSGARGELGNFDLESLGVTGYVNQNNSGITLFSYGQSGENGNNIKLTRFSSDLRAINIPHRYFRSGQTLRPLLNSWTGTFTGTFFSLSIENTGIYSVIFDPENAESTISGIIFENNFDRNWSTNITPISEGNILNTGFQNTLLYNPSTKIFSGNFNITSGLAFMGYSGLNIDFNKRSFNHPNNTGNIAKYIISGDRFLFTGFLEG